MYFVESRLFNFADVKQRIKKAFFRLIKLIPQVRKKIETEMTKVSQTFEKDVQERTKDLKYITKLPEKGFSPDRILQITDENLSLGKCVVLAVT